MYAYMCVLCTLVSAYQWRLCRNPALRNLETTWSLPESSHLSCLCEARIWSRSRLGSSDRGFNWPRSLFSGSPTVNGRWVMKAGSLGSPWRSKHQSFKDTPWWKSFIDCIIKSSLIVFDCALIARAVLASAAEGLVGFHPWRSLVTKNLN